MHFISLLSALSDLLMWNASIDDFVIIQGAGLTRLPLHVSAPADFQCLGLIIADQKTKRFHEKFIYE